MPYRQEHDHARHHSLGTGFHPAQRRLLGILETPLHHLPHRGRRLPVTDGRGRVLLGGPTGTVYGMGTMTALTVAEILKPTGRLKASREALFEALQTEDLSETHRFVLAEIQSLEAQMRRFEAYLL